MEEILISGKILARVINAFTDPVYVKDSSFHFIMLNDVFCRTFNLKQEEIIGKTDYDFFPREKADIYTAIDKLVLSTSAGQTNEVTKADSDNILRTFQITKSLYTDEFGEKFIIGIMREITERRLAELKRQEMERKFFVLMNNLSGFAYRCKNDRNWTMEFISEGFYELTGYNPEDLLTHKKITYNEIIHEEWRERVWENQQQTLRDRVQYIDEYIIRHACGELRWVMEKGIGIYDSDGNVEAIEGYITDITELKKTEQTLQQTESKFRRLVETAREGIWIFDENGISKFANPRMGEILGYGAEELIGINILSFILPEDLPDHKKKSELRRSGLSNIYERRLRTKSGQMIWTNISATALMNEKNEFSGSFMLVTDMSDYKKKENELRTAHSLLENIIEFLPDATFVIDRNKKVIAWNHAIEEMTGVPKKDMLGLNDYVYSVPFYGSKRPIVIDLAGKSDISEYEKFYDIVKRSGDILYTEVFVPSLYGGRGAYVSGRSSSILDKDGNFLGAIESVRDITERKMHEKELEIARDKAGKSDKLKSEFLAQMSHEIRTPINIMLSYIQLVREDLAGPESSEGHEYFTAIKRAGERIIRTIDLLLNMSEIQTGSYECVFRDIRLYKEVLERVYLELNQKAKNKNLRLILTSPPEDFIVTADQYSIEQIFVNLIDNAIKYTKEGEVIISSCTDKTKRLSINITDTGIGIAEEYLKELFTPFSQEEQGYTRRYEGNGLGLSLVKKYCEMNKIDIEVDSRKSEGSTFTVIFDKYKIVPADGGPAYSDPGA